MISFSDFFSSAISSISEKTKNYFSENKKYALIMSIIILVMTLSAVIVITLTFGKNKNTPVSTENEVPLVITEQLLFPQSPVVSENYLYSREQNSSWSEEDAKSWFTSPSQNTLDELSSSNDRIVTEIMGAAP